MILLTDGHHEICKGPGGKLRCRSRTTGLSAEQEASLEAAAAIPVLYAANYSLGVNLLLKLTQAAKGVPDFDIEIVEMHHGQRCA